LEVAPRQQTHHSARHSLDVQRGASVEPRLAEGHSPAERGILLDVRKRDLGEVYADGVLLTNVDAELSTEPDLCFASWQTFESGKLRASCNGAREVEATCTYPATAGLARS
jgi:hypothetical protein